MAFKIMYFGPLKCSTTHKIPVIGVFSAKLKLLSGKNAIFLGIGFKTKKQPKLFYL
jgi:hypothetical protein